MKSYLKRIDTRTAGNRYDVTPLFAHAGDFKALIEDMASEVLDLEIDLIGAIDALGFVMGAALALKLNVGIITIRKGHKLPVKTDRVSLEDYSGQEKQLEIRRDIIVPGQRVLIVDEWIETGSQVSAAITLLERQGADIAGIATINMDDNPSTRSIRNHYAVFSAWHSG